MVYSKLTQISNAPRRESLLALAIALVSASCTHHLQTVSPPAVTTMMTRQAHNAVDLGDGDVEAQRLRKRLAADARDLDARISLARLYTRRGLPDLALEHYRLAAVQFPDSPVV